MTQAQTGNLLGRDQTIASFSAPLWRRRVTVRFKSKLETCLDFRRMIGFSMLIKLSRLMFDHDPPSLRKMAG